MMKSQALPKLSSRLWLTLFMLTCLYVTHSSGSRVMAQAGTGTLRVATTGTDVVGCGAAGAPCRTIQFAVNQSNSGDTILVAAGTYTFDSSRDPCSAPLGTAGVVCVVNKQLTILGGYTARNWSDADPTANVTTIDGENTQRGVAVISPGSSAPPTSLRMEGFTIRRGIARGISSRPPPDNIFAYGGGMLAELAPVTLRNMIFDSNQAVGENTLTDFGGTGSGGGLAIRLTSSTSTLENVTFTNNQALGGTGVQRGGYGIGGGLYTYRAVVTASSITLNNNIATGGASPGSGSTADGQRADAQGAGATIHDGSTATLQYVRASGNQATGGTALTNAGGAFGGALHVESNQFPTSLSLIDSDLRGNLAQGGNAVNGGLGNGGGIETFNSTATLNRVMIINNTGRGGNGLAGNAGSAGGGGLNSVRLRSDSTSISIVNSVVADNLAALGTTGTQVGGGGGGIWLQGVQADIVHTTVAGNRFGSLPMQGQGILLINDGVPTPSVANISYSIIANHTGFGASAAALHVKPGNTVTVNRGLYAGNSKDDNADGSPAPAGTFNGLASMLSASAVGFVSPGSPSFNYHITASSAAKDQATGSTTPIDIDLERRPFGPASDIGADEYVFYPFVIFAPLVIR